MSFLEQLPMPFFALAPMDDVTDTVFRQIIADIAPPDLYFTEFVNVDGLQSPGRPKLLHKLSFSNIEKPIIAQLWGLKPENFYKTTQEIIKMGFDGVDINMGCPVKTVIKNGACAALMNNRELAGQIIDAVQQAAGETPACRQAGFPVSVKTRTGFYNTDLAWIEFLLSKKLNMLTVHGRTVKQLSIVPADWKLIGEIKKMRDFLSPDTKIIGNGDVKTRQQGLELAKKYDLDGIMIGRGIFDDPFVFAQNSLWSKYAKQQKIDLYRKHVKLFAQTWQNKERKIETLNKFCKVYISGFGEAKQLREQLMSAKEINELINTLDSNI